MSPRAATDEEVLAAARRVLEDFPTVVSQRRMGQRVSKALEPGGASGVTGERLRKLLMAAPFCRVEFRVREDRKRRALYQCPICGSAIRRAKNRTLFGGEVTLTLRCTRCRYWTGQHRRVPTLYTFHQRRSV